MSGILSSSIGCSWRLSAFVICSKSHQVRYVLVQEAGLLTLSLSLPRSSFRSFQLRLRPSSWPTYIFLVLQVAPACLPACLSISLISDSRVQLPQPPPAPTRGRACPRTQQALCPEGLKFLLGAGGLKNQRGQPSAWEAKERR